MRYFFYLLLIALLTSSCNKEIIDIELNDEDYLIFGVYYGFCGQNCTILYKLTSEDIFQDDIDFGLPYEIPFQKDPMTRDKFEIAKQLTESFPKALLEEPKNIIGCPDCVDQGGYYIEYKTEDTRDHWRIDTFNDALPEYLVQYTDQLEEVINQLQ